MSEEILREEYPRLYHGGNYLRAEFTSGRIQTQVETSDGTLLVYTEMSDYDMYAGSLPWQEPHTHRGLTESYTLIDGWIHFIYGLGTTSSCHFTESGQTIRFLPRVPHVVLLGPKAKLSTVCFGTPIPNPERNGIDWWPADNVFAVPALLEQLRVEEDFVHC